MFEAQIERGAALLDERGPAHWRELLDVDTLDLYQTYHCVLGQLYNHVRGNGLTPYYNGVERLGGPTIPQDASLHVRCLADQQVQYWCIWRGFAALDVAMYDRLTAEWRAYVERTRFRVPTLPDDVVARLEEDLRVGATP